MLIQKPRIPIKDFILFGLLPCWMKKCVYRFKGYRIGQKFSIGFGSIICAKDVDIGDYSKIGFFTIIRGNKIKIGSHVTIGSTTFLDTPFIEIGDDSKINEQVFVGGLQHHDSRFVLGKNCQIMQMSFINPAKSVTLGDDSGIGGYSLVFGHASWQSQLEGYPVEFAPIEIGNSVSITWRGFIMPGVKIGDGAVIGPNSLVNRDIPPKCLAAGFPARVLSRYPDFPKEISVEQKVAILKNIVDEMITYFNGSGLICTDHKNHFEIRQIKKLFLRKKTKTWRLGIAYENTSEDKAVSHKRRLDVFVSLKTIPVEIRRRFNADKTMWLDIEKKERPLFWNDLGDEVALFLRRYGVRFNRVEV
jgi:acetyltransferase-like isoleucine patch superfamily enzyme